MADSLDHAELTNTYGIYMIGFFVIPPFLGAIAYIFISKWLGNLYFLLVTMMIYVITPRTR